MRSILSIVTCLGVTAKQRLPLQLNIITCLDACGEQWLPFGLNKGLTEAPVTAKQRVLLRPKNPTC